MPTVFGTPRLVALPAGSTALLGDQLINRTTGAVYSWPRNHASEDPTKGLGRVLARGGQSGKIRMMRHAAHPGPIVLSLHGQMLDVTPPTQYTKFLTFFDDCDDVTFDYLDVRGDSYEVILAQFDAPRQIDRPDGTWFTYGLEFVVLSINGSPLTDFFA